MNRNLRSNRDCRSGQRIRFLFPGEGLTAAVTFGGATLAIFALASFLLAVSSPTPARAQTNNQTRVQDLRNATDSASSGQKRTSAKHLAEDDEGQDHKGEDDEGRGRRGTDNRKTDDWGTDDSVPDDIYHDDEPAEDPAWLNLRPYPLAVWGPRVGFGGGVGLVLNDMVQRGDETLATIAPAQFEQVYTLSYTTAAGPALTSADGWMMVGGRHAYTTRDWFYGFGPASATDARVAFSLRTFQGSIRAGRYLFPDELLGGTLLFQAHARVEHYRLYDADLPDFSTPPDEGSVSNPTPVGRTLRYAESIADLATDAVRSGASITTTGTVLGGDLAYDWRDRDHLTTRGVLLQARAERWLATSGATFAYWRTDVDAYGWLPIAGRHRIALRVRLSQVHETTGATQFQNALVDTNNLPHFVLPRLDGRDLPGLARSRYHGHDVLAVSAAYEFPIRTVLGFRVEGHIGAYAGSAYDDIGEQFEFAVDGSETLDGSRETYPLRPTMAAGLRVGPQFRDDTYVDVAVGRGPDGFSAVRFSLVRRLSRPRPPHHTTNHWRR